MHKDWFRDGLPGSPEINFSVRPQSLKLERAGTAVNGRVAVEGAVSQRTFLGEHWDYTFQPAGSGLQLKVSAPPSDVFEIGEASVLALDPALMVAIQ